MKWLLDGNVLVALVIKSHQQHARASVWFASSHEPYLTCSITEGTLLRLHMTYALDRSALAAWNTLARLRADPRHEFLDAGFSYAEVSHLGLLGHKQVTDAWLAELARRYGAKLATLDAGLVAMHPDVGFLLP